MLDRLRLTPERIGSIASDMEAVSHLRSPQGEELARWTRPNGMTIVKRRVPFGVVGMVCEARPNVTADIFALCVKTGNACVPVSYTHLDVYKRQRSGTCLLYIRYSYSSQASAATGRRITTLRASPSTCSGWARKT